MENVQLEYPFIYPLVLGVITITIGIYLGLKWFHGNENSGLSFIINIYTEILSIIVTVFIIDRINQHRETQRLKEKLVFEAGSTSNERAKLAVDRIRKESWQKGHIALLRNASVSVADLSNAELYDFDLKYSKFWYTKLGGATLFKCDLEKAELWRTDLYKANLRWADFKNAIMSGVNLKGADLTNANLEGAIFIGFKLDDTLYAGYAQNWASELPTGAYDKIKPRHQYKAEFDENTILPDGTMWHKKVNMRKFTDPYHADFWSIDFDEDGEPVWYKNK